MTERSCRGGVLAPPFKRLTCQFKRLAWTAAMVALSTVATPLPSAAATGRDLNLQVRWHKQLGAKPSEAWKPRETAQPILSPKGSLLFFSVPEGLAAYTRKTGEIRWQVTTPERVVGTPVLSKSRLFAATLDGQVLALDANSGKLVWPAVTRLGVTIRGPLAADDRHVYVPADPPSVTALDRKTGQPSWRWTASVDRPFTVEGQSGVVLVGDLAVFGTATGKVVAVSARDGGLTWETVLEDPSRSPYGDVDQTPLVVPRAKGEPWIVAASQSGGVYAMASADGKVLWHYADEALGTPYLMGDKLVLLSSLGRLLVLQLEDGKVVQQSLLPCAPSGHLTPIAGDLALIPHEAGLDVLDWRHGVLRSRLATEVGFAAAPLLYDGMAYALSNAGQLYALDVRIQPTLLDPM